LILSLKNQTSDDIYLQKLKETLKTLQRYHFDILFYQAGVDALKEDRFGLLNLTHEGLKERDRMVFEYAREFRLPVSMAIGGGYALDINQSVQANFNTFCDG
jgi:acetoin utilization deacetylase AcuC-like enzyme